jgi:hypothetical protein
VVPHLGGLPAGSAHVGAGGLQGVPSLLGWGPGKLAALVAPALRLFAFDKSLLRNYKYEEPACEYPFPSVGRKRAGLFRPFASPAFLP